MCEVSLYGREGTAAGLTNRFRNPPEPSRAIPTGWGGVVDASVGDGGCPTGGAAIGGRGWRWRWNGFSNPFSTLKRERERERERAREGERARERKRERQRKRERETERERKRGEDCPTRGYSLIPKRPLL